MKPLVVINPVSIPKRLTWVAQWIGAKWGKKAKYVRSASWLPCPCAEAHLALGGLSPHSGLLRRELFLGDSALHFFVCLFGWFSFVLFYQNGKPIAAPEHLRSISVSSQVLPTWTREQRHSAQCQCV